MVVELNLLYAFDYALIFILSLIQSIIGVGILFFGTPLFILLGFDFFYVQSILLPTSLAVSIFTLKKSKHSFVINKYDLFMLFFIFCGVYISSLIVSEMFLAFVGIIFICTALLQLKKKYLSLTHYKIFRSNTVIYGIAFLHGISNQGGGLLVWWASLQNFGKDLRRTFVAKYYALMAAFQITSLMAIDSQKFIKSFRIEIVLIGIISFLLGNNIFSKLQQKNYEDIISIFMVLIGVVLLINILGFM